MLKLWCTQGFVKIARQVAKRLIGEEFPWTRSALGHIELDSTTTFSEFINFKDENDHMISIAEGWAYGVVTDSGGKIVGIGGKYDPNVNDKSEGTRWRKMPSWRLFINEKNYEFLRSVMVRG